MQLLWFSQRQRAPAAIDPAPAYTPELNLIAAQGAQAIIDVVLEGGTTPYQSAIVKIDADAGTLLIDELFPPIGAPRPGQSVTITLRLDGDRRQRFTARVLEQRREQGVLFYLLKLPSTVGYLQRRSAFRLKLERSWGVTAEFFLPDYGRRNVCALDISSLGMRLELPEPLPVSIGTGLPELFFDFCGTSYACSAVVRNIRYTVDHMEIGIGFVGLSRPQQRALERSIMLLQRRHVQRLHVVN